MDELTVAQLLDGAEERTVVVNIQDAPEAPVLISRPLSLYWQASSDAEEAAVLIQSLDPDVADSARYEILAGDPDGFLQIDPDSGQLSLVPGIELPRGRSRLPVTVRVTDAAGLSDATTFVVDLIRFPSRSCWPPLTRRQAYPRRRPTTPVTLCRSPVPMNRIQSRTRMEYPLSLRRRRSPQTAPSADNAVSQSGLISRFLPVLLMCRGTGHRHAAAPLRRAREAVARQDLQHRAQMLAHPLPDGSAVNPGQRGIPPSSRLPMSRRSSCWTQELLHFWRAATMSPNLSWKLLTSLLRNPSCRQQLLPSTTFRRSNPTWVFPSR